MHWDYALDDYRGPGWELQVPKDTVDVRLQQFAHNIVSELGAPPALV